MSAVAQVSQTWQNLREALRFQFKHATVGLAELQAPGEIIALNPAMERMLGVASEAETIPLEEIIPSERRAQSERCVRELLEGERPDFRFESRSAAETQVLRWSAWRVPGIVGQSDTCLAIVDDTTNSQLEQRLRQAERLEAVGRLAGGVAHDFNNLLTGVLLYCDLLLANVEAGHPVRKYAEEIRSAGVQASGLVRQLLVISRPKSSEPRLLSLNEIVEGMRNLMVHLIGENMRLHLQLDPDLGLVRMDPTQAQQILLNLVLNARDAMPAGGTITVETSNCQVQILPGSSLGVSAAALPCAIFAVADNGSGMDAETRAHLFEAFFTTKAASKGSGLGLATVHDIVTSNGGLIHVDSAPQRGTRVTVLLPLVPADWLASNRAQGSDDFHTTKITGENSSH
jgi:two-component system cell cycle sensor histidine kinase/response regulator CckA